jgi:hypothetical protein
LIEIKGGQQAGQRVNEFIMNVTVTRAKPEDNTRKPAPKPAAKG